MGNPCVRMSLSGWCTRCTPALVAPSSRSRRKVINFLIIIGQPCITYVRTCTLQKMIVEITINWLPQFRKSIVFETELTKKMFILTIIFYSVEHTHTQTHKLIINILTHAHTKPQTHTRVREGCGQLMLHHMLPINNRQLLFQQQQQQQQQKVGWISGFYFGDIVHSHMGILIQFIFLNNA